MLTTPVLSPPVPSDDMPLAPTTLAEAGLGLDLMTQLALKHLHFAGELKGSELADRLRVNFSVLEPVLEFLKVQHQVEVTGGSMRGAASYYFRITDPGRIRVGLFLQTNQYVGVAPVPYEQYISYMRAFVATSPRRRANRDQVREALSHLVVSQPVLDQLGPAINSGHSMFVYGPPGNGKTMIAQTIRKLLGGDMAIPHAIEVEGSIIRLFDPVNHEPIDETPLDADQLKLPLQYDRRWVRCKRPMVMVGGELNLAALDLSFNPVTGFYRAPVQAVANGGVLVIDDFGRQQCSPRDLLNRWIVPLESRIDFLTLQSGQKFEIPFAVLIVFATNINPSELVDEAFLRRIRYKVYAQGPTIPEFTRIFEKCCRDRNLQFDPALVEHLLKAQFEPRNIELRGCHSRDLIDQSLSLADYRGDPRQLTAELLDAACAGYFVDHT